MKPITEMSPQELIEFIFDSLRGRKGTEGEGKLSVANIEALKRLKETIPSVPTLADLAQRAHIYADTIVDKTKDKASWNQVWQNYFVAQCRVVHGTGLYHVGVIIHDSPISERMWRKGQEASIEYGQIKVGGNYFDFDGRWKVEPISVDKRHGSNYDPDKEYILCAATWFDDGKEYKYQPKNTDSGIVLCGWRHPAMFQQIGGLVRERQELGIYEKEQGFLTNKNRFVDREEGLKIARAANQILPSRNPYRELHSEDLY